MKLIPNKNQIISSVNAMLLLSTLDQHRSDRRCFVANRGRKFIGFLLRNGWDHDVIFLPSRIFIFMLIIFYIKCRSSKQQVYQYLKKIKIEYLYTVKNNKCYIIFIRYSKISIIYQIQWCLFSIVLLSYKQLYMSKYSYI